jgi:phosphonate transport system permease protein
MDQADRSALNCALRDRVQREVEDIIIVQLDENIRSSLVLGFVGAGGIGFQLLTDMNLFQYQDVSLLLIIIFVIVLGAERMSAALRERLA